MREGGREGGCDTHTLTPTISSSETDSTHTLSNIRCQIAGASVKTSRTIDLCICAVFNRQYRVASMYGMYMYVHVTFWHR